MVLLRPQSIHHWHWSIFPIVPSRYLSRLRR